MKTKMNFYLSRCMILLCLFCAGIGKMDAQSTITCTLVPMQPVTICENGCATVLNQTYQVPGDTTCFPGWIWTMPGGSPSSYNGFQPPCITYTTSGTYTVTLFGMDSSGDTTSANSVSTTVTVVAPLSSGFSINPNPACINEGVLFTATDPNILLGNYVSWDFGDGNFGNGVNYNYAYTAGGTYTVTCCVGNECDTTCTSQIITINEPRPRFTWSGTCSILFVSDTTCAGQIISHSWDFGDGSPLDPNANPIHTFPQDNISYTVVHTITTSNGTFSYSDQVTQVGPPHSDITGYQTNNCGNGFLTYTATPCTPGLVYTWTISGGTLSTTTGCQTNANWGFNGGFIYLAIWDSVADCTGYDTLRIPPCCIDTGSNFIQIWNKSASEVLTDPIYAAYVTGTTFSSNTTQIIINGVFTVDTTFTFFNCASISFGANALTYTESGQTFTYDDSQVGGKCGVMWDGNYIQDATATLNIINGSRMYQARKSVYSIDGGKFFIEDSELRTCYKDIVVDPYAQPHTGAVRNTDFTMVGNFAPAFPALPVGHNKTVCGVEIVDNASITIGDATQAQYRNRFNNILVGVRAHNSVTTVVNARFANMNPTFFQLVNVPNAGTGVVATGKKNLYYQPAITVGGGGLSACVFVDMRTAVDVFERTHVTVLNNNISQVRQFGIRVRNSQQTLININDNFITNQTASIGFNTAINVLECYGSTVNILRNNIRQDATIANQNGTGIRVACVSPADVTANVVGNTTDRVKTGILVQNLIGKNKVFIGGNRVNFSKPNAQYTTIHSGIKLEGCATVRCDTNVVTKSGANPVLGMEKNLRGISVDNSPSTIVSDNIFNKMGSGIYGFEISTASTLACNTMVRCFNGVLLAGTPATGNACDIGDQIQDPFGTPSATGNTWVANVVPNQQVTGNAFPFITWRWDQTPPTNGNSVGITVPGAPTPYNACSQFFFLAPQPTERDKQVGAALRTAADTSTGFEQRYQLRRYAHRRLTQTPAWLSLGTPDDSLYQNFYNNYNPTNMGTLRQVELAADSGDFVNVSSTCAALSCSNLLEHNLKVVYGIYSATWMVGVYEFTPADSAILLNIALQDPVEGGTAVYSARVMLDIDVDDSGNSQRISQQQETPASASSDVKVYPNPASESINLEYGVDEGQTAQVEIFDLSGHRVLSQQLAPQQEVYTIETAALSAGVYMLRIVVDGESTEGQRLVIID